MSLRGITSLRLIAKYNAYCVALPQFLVALPVVEPTEESEADQAAASVDRTYTISWQEVRQLLGWTPDMVAHPLDDLDILLQVRNQVMLTYIDKL